MKSWHWVPIGLIVALLIFLIAREIPFIQTNSRLDEAINQVVRMDNPPPVVEMDVKDAWGSSLIFRFSRDTKQLTYTVISKGPDGIEGTEDDLRRERIDHNIARSIGEWTASKAKEFLKGAKDGISKKSKYDPPDEEEKK